MEYGKALTMNAHGKREPTVDLTEEEIVRYSRSLILPEVGLEGQRRLRSSRAFMVGAGGIGSAPLLYLAAAGVGRIGIADPDTVELSNLQRQIIHCAGDAGRLKVESAADRIRTLNPHCHVELYSDGVNVSNIREAVRGYDVVLDGSDNFPTRFLVADCCWLEKIPLVWAAAVRFHGQLFVVSPGDGGPCHRCLMPQEPSGDAADSCRRSGVFGPVVGVMGSLQAVEALKILLGLGSPMARRLLDYDALRCEFSTLERRRDPSCPLCGDNPRITDLAGPERESKRCGE